MRLGKDVSAEKIGDQWLVVSHRDNAAHHLSGPAATVIDCVTSGQKIPEGYDDTVTGLITLGVLEPAPGLSRRQVISTAAAATAIGVTSVALPTAAFASSPGSSTPDPGPPPPAPMVWSAIEAAENNGWQSVAHGLDGIGNPLWVAVANSGTSNRVMTSVDGLTWTARTAEERGWVSVAYGSNRWVAVANRPFTPPNDLAMTSTDGTTWTQLTDIPGVGVWEGVAFGNSLWVAVANNDPNNLMTSSNGTDWTLRAQAGFRLLSVAFGNSLWVAVGRSGKVLTSADGTTWSEQTATDGVTADLSSVSRGGGLWVAVGTNTVITSPDGITWTARTAAESNQWASVAHGTDDDGDPLWVAVSPDGDNRVMTSPDGITWTARMAPEQNQWRSVAYDGNGVFVAVASSGDNRVMRFPAT